VRGRYDRLRQAISEAFLLPLMAQIATGPDWKTATADQRHDLIEGFQRMSASTLATMLDGYNGESFKLMDEKPGPQDTRYVVTNLMRTAADPVEISYFAKQVEGRWYLVDVVVDGGISELSVRRSEYRKFLREGGVPALIGALNAKADELVGKP
jgi:phospholipid transport system substrate-binding protein